MGTDLNAGVPFYGAQSKTEDVPKIKASTNPQRGEKDERFEAGAPPYTEALKAAGIPPCRS